MRLVTVLSSQKSASGGKFTALLLLIAHLVVIPFVIEWYEYQKIYTVFVILGLSAGSKVAIYFISKFIHTI